MTAEQVRPGETTREREKETNGTSEIARTKGKEEEMQTEATRICHRGKNRTQNGKRSTHPEHSHRKSGLDEGGANAAKRNQEHRRWEDTHIRSSRNTYNERKKLLPVKLQNDCRSSN